jgi:Zn finger protein HypA/HybF involved in hydrogenase expression
MKDNRIELADVVRRFKHDYVAQFGSLMMPSQRKALADIAACMTAEMGGHQYRCRDCARTFWVYHGCRNRACPACHGRRMREWFEAREAELLPCDYYHVVATVPEELRHLFLSDQKFMYSLLMRTVAGAAIDLARNPRHVGATPAILMVMHTWTGQMQYHPHGHLLVSGGGVTDDGQSWREPSGKFLVPVTALSMLIAARFRDGLKKAKPEVFKGLSRKIWKREWCSFCKHYGRGKRAVLDYLARYAFRIAITNTRIVAMDDTHVTFRYKHQDTGQWRPCRLRGVEFLRRFLMHVLPKGFHKVRYYGLWHHSKRDHQRRAWLLLSLRTPVHTGDRLSIAAVVSETGGSPAGEEITADGFSPRCPHCGSDRVEHLQERRRGPAP